VKIFVSWSGNRSAHIADTLHWWLPNVLQVLTPFVSKQDIDKGARGELVIGNELADTNVGIVCLTPENLQKPWVLFEAGALSKTASSYLCTFIHELTPAEIERPLGAFQHTKNEKEDIRKLCVTLNKLLTPRNLELSRLNETFEMWYPKLEERMANMPKADETAPPRRNLEDMVSELLENTRMAVPAQMAGPNVLSLNQSLAHRHSGLSRRLMELAPAQLSDLKEFLRMLFDSPAKTLPLDNCISRNGFDIAERVSAIRLDDVGGDIVVKPVDELYRINWPIL
jgi:hypothetical protein